jgi:hypothetical protein
VFLNLAITFAHIFSPFSQPRTMKKFFAIAAIAGTLVACNNSSESTTASDSTTVTTDSAVVTPSDSAAITVDSAAVTVDSASAPAADAAK